MRASDESLTEFNRKVVKTWTVGAFVTYGTIIALIVAFVAFRNASACDAKAPLQVGSVAEAGQAHNASR